MLLSLVKSMLATLKPEALSTGSGQFSQAELALLEDKAYELSDKGEAIERPFFGQIEKNLRFAFRCYAKAQGLDFIPNYNRPTVSLDVISLVASSCSYYRGQIEQRAAH